MGDKSGATLDPEDWLEFRASAHNMLDSMLADMETVAERPAWQAVPADVRERLGTHQPLPEHGEPLADVLQAFATEIVPYTSGNRHPRAWGWVRGAGTPLAMLADMLAAGLNSHVGGGQSAPVMVEAQVLDWLRRTMGFPPGAGGVLTSSASVANLLGLVVARHARLGAQGREWGVAAFPRCIFYASSETHFWMQKAMVVLGFGERSLRMLPADQQGRLSAHDLRAAVQADRAAGMLPLVVIGNAGTVNTGAFDDLQGLRAVCDEEDLWLHVDGAFGAWLKLLPKEQALTSGLESAHSLAFDFHKWPSQTFATGCLLVRNGALHQQALETHAAYMEPEERGPLAGGAYLSGRGLDGSRPFAALKLWMLLRVEGLGRVRAAIAENLRQAREFAAQVDSCTELALLAPCVANVVCFAYQPEDHAAAAVSHLDALQREIALRLAESGAFLLSTTRVDTPEGRRLALRIAHTNHRSRSSDLQALLQAVIQTGRELWSGQGAG